MIILNTNVLDTHVTYVAKDGYYWPSMYRDIETYVTTCIRCQKNQSSLKSPIAPLKPSPIITKVRYRVGMDLTGPLIELNGYKYILTMNDHFTRWIETRQLISKEAARGIYSIYCRQGAPVRIITDNGTEFKKQIIFHALHKTYYSKLIFSTPYNPQTNGLVESSHKAIKQALVKSLNEKNGNWSLFLEEITFSINIRPRATTNFSAFELMHGSKKPRLPIQEQNQAYQYPKKLP